MEQQQTPPPPQSQSPAQPPPQPQAQPAAAPSPPPPQQPPFTLPPSTVPNTTTTTSPNPNPNPTATTQFHRPPWDPQTQQHYRHFAPSNPAVTTSGGGMAIGVPAPQMGPASFNANTYGQRFPATAASGTTTQMRPQMQTTQGMGMRGPVGSGPPTRAGGIAMQHQQRPIQSSVRPQTTPINQPSSSQNMQGHVMPRGPVAGSPASAAPGASQGLQTHNQPWLSSGAAPRPPMPNTPFRAQMNHPQTLQQRSHIPQQHHPQIPMPSQRPQMSSPSSPLLQQQSSSNEGILESHRQQVPTSQGAQQLNARSAGIGTQKLVSNLGSQPSMVSTGLPDKTANLEIVETCNRVISKRSIQELVSQIDPTEKLDPDVEDLLVDIAEDFVESVTTSACSLAKHRKSATLEAKDVLLHLDRNWHMTLPGFTGDEIKCYKRPSVNDIHKERLAVIRKSATSADVKGSAGQAAAGSAKSHIAKPEVAQPP